MANKPGIFGSFNQEFLEQIEFFQQKVRLPTKTWLDLWQGQHAPAFVVAGATRDALLEDFQTAILKAKKTGTGIKEFREDFDRIVATHGWSYKGSPGWRSRVIFETNMRTAYQAGRYKQMTDPDLLKLCPYWEYRHGGSKNPRPEHLAWHGKVLRADDPWWRTHFPPNGWGCSCTAFALSKRDIEREGLKVSETPPEELEEKLVGRGDDARVVQVPKGIDPGWDYNVGEAAWGRPVTKQAMTVKPGGWRTITPGDWQSNGLPDRIPLEPPASAPAPRGIVTREDVVDYLKREFKGDEKVFEFNAGEFAYPVLVNAETLADHIPPNRGPFLSFLEETITNPTEAWLTFEESEETGLVALRIRFIKGHDVGSGKAIIVVANARRGVLEGWTFIPTSKISYANAQRRGKLLKRA